MGGGQEERQATRRNEVKCDAMRCVEARRVRYDASGKGNLLYPLHQWAWACGSCFPDGNVTQRAGRVLQEGKAR